MNTSGLRNHQNLSFGTSPNHSFGLKLKIKFQEDTNISYGEVTLSENFQGNHNGYVHPGILSIILDEAMLIISSAMNLNVHTSELNIRFLQRARVNSPLYFRAYFVKKNHSIIENRVEIEDDLGKILVRAKGRYTEVDPLKDI